MFAKRMHASTRTHAHTRRPARTRVPAHSRLATIQTPRATGKSEDRRLGPALWVAQDLTFCDNGQIRVFLVVLSLAPLATSRSVARPWPVPRVSVRRVVPSNSGRRARMRSASGGTKPREFCTPRFTAGLTESGSSRLLLLPQQQSAAAPIRKLMTSIAAGGSRAATAGVRLCTATCPRLRTMCARIG